MGLEILQGCLSCSPTLVCAHTRMHSGNLLRLILRVSCLCGSDSIIGEPVKVPEKRGGVDAACTRLVAETDVFSRGPSVSSERTNQVQGQAMRRSSCLVAHRKCATSRVPNVAKAAALVGRKKKTLLMI